MIGRSVGVAFGHAALHLDGAAHRVDDAGEFDEEAVAGGFDDAAAMLDDLRVEQGAAILPPFPGNLLVARPDQVPARPGCEIARHRRFQVEFRLQSSQGWRS